VSERPGWIRVRAPSAMEMDGVRAVREALSRHRLMTVCQSAVCPNAVECWGGRTATFMVLGRVCTRACRFCAVETGDPRGAVDADEPKRLAAAVADLGLRYVVLTSVDRDDLLDGGAELFARCVEELKSQADAPRVEVLLPDFRGDCGALARLVGTQADVFGHNLETVRRLSPALRDRRASYDQSLRVLAHLAHAAGGRKVKSGLMLGLGETRCEIREALCDLRQAGVDFVTIGQYLRPTPRAIEVARYVSPTEFEAIRQEGEEMGFDAVLAGPFVRSSYHAERILGESCAS